MLSEALTAATPEDLLTLPLFTLILFVAVFAGVVWRVWLRGADDPSHTYAAGLPLAADDRLGGDGTVLRPRAPRASRPAGDSVTGSGSMADNPTAKDTHEGGPDRG